ncbi:sodium:solute symporter [Clostridium scatologenes]|uniref:Sodium:solute symporter n=1 Tax=Clostridium scatologenes TaxID=1548 RepID=A0A0E3JZ38_CLOSL|nr:sodium:solute symporter [Clostridium scatologenes]AKA69480.1 sodium:solute symporter [Clostridium scatologenes]
MLTTFDYGIIILYFIIMISIGIISTKFTKTKEDYLVAGRRLGFPMFFGCMAALAVGGAATIGSAKLGYKFGISGIWLGGSLGLGLIALGFLVSSKLSKMKALSINEVIENNYGKSARIFSSLLTFIYTMMMSVVQVVSVGAIISGIMGWNAQLSMLVGGGIVIFYTFVGGMWSVSMTDIIQFVIKTLGIIILIPIFALVKIGGFSHLTASLPQTHFNLTTMGYDSIVMYLLMYIPGLIIGQDIWQRIFTAKNEKIARKGTILAGFYSIIYGSSTVLLGLCVYVAAPALKNPQDAFVTGVTLFLPIGIKGFVIAAAMAATMSVASGSVLASSTILYNDLYTRFINKTPDEKKSILINRLFAFLIGVGVMIIAFLIQDVLTALDMAYAYLSGCVFVPVLSAFVLKKFSAKAGLASLFLSTIVVSVTFFKYGVDSNYPIIFGIIVGALTYLIVNSMDKNKVESSIDVKEDAAS